MAGTTSRRRGAELERAILDAAWAELTEAGYAKLTMEAIAARAGTSKSVLYRRWSGRAELVLAAWDRRAPASRISRSSPDTGSLRSDLITVFGRLARRADSMTNELVAGVLGEAFRHPEMAGLIRERLRSTPLVDVVAEIVRRAVERGELPDVRLPDRAARLPVDLVRVESMLDGRPVSDNAIAELVDDVYIPLLRGLPAR